MNNIPSEVLPFYQYLCALVGAKGNKKLAQRSAKQRSFDARVINVLNDLFALKSAVAAARIGDTTWAGPLQDLRTLSSGFIESIRSISALDALSPYMRTVPRGVNFAVTSATASASIVAEGAWKPLTKLAFTGDILDSQKALALVVITNDMLRFSPEPTQSLLFTELQRAVAFATDGTIVSALADGAPTGPSGGEARGDLIGALQDVPMDATSRPFILTSPDVVKNLALIGFFGISFPDIVVPSGGAISGMPVIGLDSLSGYDTSTSPPSDVLIVVDATQLAGDAGVIELDVATSGDIAMLDGPANNPQTVTSLFQTDSLALQAERWFSFRKIRANAACVITGVGRYDS